MVAKLDGTNGLLQQYDYQAPTTGFSYTFAAGVNVLVMNPAGTLATGTITMPASPADGMTISFSSTQTITALTVNANTGQSIVRKPTSFGAGSAMTFVYRLSNTTWYPMTNYATAGTVLQVVQGSYSTQVSSSSATLATTNLTASITPSSATSKVLVIVSSASSYTQAASRQISFAIFRGATNVYGSGQYGAQLYSNSADIETPHSMVFLDSPSTTSSTAYSLYFASTNGGSVNFNQNNNNSYIILMEIAA